MWLGRRLKNQEVGSSNSGTHFTLFGVKTSLPFRLKREKIIENEAGVGHFSKRLKIGDG